MRIVISVISLLLVSCSSDKIQTNLACFLDQNEHRFSRHKQSRSILIGHEKISLFEGSEVIYSVNSEQINSVLARRLPNDVYELDLELENEERSIIYLGKSDGNCLNLLSQANDTFIAKIY